MSAFKIPEAVRQDLIAAGWDGVSVLEPEDEQPTLPLHEQTTDDDIPFAKLDSDEQAVAEAGIAPGPALGGRPVARRTDPGTSHAAARSIKDDALRLSQRAVLLLFDRLGPMTDEAVAAVYETAAQGGIAEVRHLLPIPRQSPSGLRTRRDELVGLGYLQDTGEKKRLASGRMAIVWGRTALAVRDDQ